MVMDWASIRDEFPILQQRVKGRRLIYLDNAATSQKPRVVIEAMSRYYERDNANVHRGMHELSRRATASYEGAREKVARYLGAGSAEEIVFTRGTTEAINLVAHSFGSKYIKAGDVILLTELEHHANIVPWQMLCERVGATIRVVPISDDGVLDSDATEKMLTDDVKLFAFTHISNALGTINPAQALCAMARARGIPTLIDGSQAAPHMQVDIQALGCDFYVFTGHKVFAPTGTGVLWGKRKWLDAMPPFLGGGEMIEQVSFKKTTYSGIPNKFEAGTPNIAGVIGLGAAIESLLALGITAVAQREKQLAAYAYDQLSAVESLTLFGPKATRAPVFSFAVKNAHAHDLAMLLDQEGIAIRSGQHCAHPLMQRLGVSATARASLAFYNTEAEIDALIRGIAKAQRILA